MSASDFFTSTYGLPFISGLIAALVAMLSTLAIEKLGPRATILATMPTTVLPSCVGMYVAFVAQNDLDTALYMFQRAQLLVPCGVLINATFLSLWTLLPRRWNGLASMSDGKRTLVLISLSLLYWAILALLFVIVVKSAVAQTRTNTVPLVLGLASWLILMIWSLFATWTPPSSHPAKSPSPFYLIVLRGIVAFFVIASGILIARISDVGGSIMSVFPAIFVTTLASLSLHSQLHVDCAVPGMRLGSNAMAVFCLVASATLPLWGAVWGVLVAFFVAVLGISLPAHFYMGWRQRVQSISKETPIVLTIQSQQKV